MDIILEMAKDKALDANIVDLLQANLQDVNEYRQTVAQQALENYRHLLCSVNECS